jgi:hypothetical protein
VKSIWTLRTVSTTAQQDGEAGDVKHSVCIPSHILVLDPFLSIVFKIHLFYYKKVDLILKYMRKCKKILLIQREIFPHSQRAQSQVKKIYAAVSDVRHNQLCDACPAGPPGAGLRDGLKSTQLFHRTDQLSSSIRTALLAPDLHLHSKTQR